MSIEAGSVNTLALARPEGDAIKARADLQTIVNAYYPKGFNGDSQYVDVVAVLVSRDQAQVTDSINPGKTDLSPSTRPTPAQNGGPIS